MHWGEGKCKGRWEKCGGGVKNVLGGGEGEVEKLLTEKLRRSLRGGGVEEVGVGGRLGSGVLGSGGLKSGELK